MMSQQPLSLYTEGLREAERHKWIESQKLGHDVGRAALEEWFRRHWLRYCRCKRLEHVFGRRQWTEFDDKEFGLLPRVELSGDLLLDRILDRADDGWENLDMICWAHEWGLPINRLLGILLQLNLNCARIDPNLKLDINRSGN